MKEFIKTLWVMIFCFQSVHAQQNLTLENGDLIFIEAQSNENISKAIKEVTSGVDGYYFTHIGIVWKQKETYVIEAIHPEVTISPIENYLDPVNRSRPRIVIARLKEKYKPLIPKAIEEALKLVHKKYDDAFDLNNDQYYCSELIYDILLKANNNVPVFSLNTMTFKIKNTNEFSPEWKKHFEKLDIPIPEGELGINPGAMSKQSDVIDIIYHY